MLHDASIVLGLLGLVGAVVVIHVFAWQFARRGDHTLPVFDPPPDFTADSLMQLHRQIMARLCEQKKPALQLTWNKIGRIPVLATDGPIAFADGLSNPGCVISCGGSVSGSGIIEAGSITSQDLTISQAHRIDVPNVFASDFAKLECDEILIRRLGADGSLQALVGRLWSTRISSARIEITSRGPTSRNRPSLGAAAASGRRCVREGSVRIPNGTTVSDDMVCLGDLVVGDRVVFSGRVKVYGALKAAEDVVFKAPLIVNGKSSFHGRTVFEDATILKKPAVATDSIFIGTAVQAASVVAHSLNGVGIFGNGSIAAVSTRGIVVQ